jgi:hypothetical protein
MLDNVSSKLTSTNNGFSIELLFSPSVLDNVVNWRVFNDDQNIIQFLTNEDTFKDAISDDGEHSKSLNIGKGGMKYIKGNSILKKVLTLEKLYDLSSIF